MEAEKESIQTLVSARKLLKTGFEKSKSISSVLDKTRPNLNKISRELSSLQASIKQRSIFIDSNIDGIIASATAVLTVFESVCELEKSVLVLNPSSDIFHYLAHVKRLEESTKLLTNSCTLAIQWLEGFFVFLVDNNNSMVDDRYIVNVKKTLKIVLHLREVGARNGYVLGYVYRKLETEFERLLETDIESSLLTEGFCVPVLPSSSNIRKLQALVERLSANDMLTECVSVYVEYRSSIVSRSLRVDYLDKQITEFDNADDIERYVDQWSRDFEVAVKHVYPIEYGLSRSVFDKADPNVWSNCFAKISTRSGFLSLIRFAISITQCRKDPIKMLKLLDVFGVLNDLRIEFNTVFHGESCVEIRNVTRNLVKRIVNESCEIFRDLPFQVELQRRSFRPSDGGVPTSVSFVTDFCNRLLSLKYKPIMTQVLKIQQSWGNIKKLEDDIVIKQVYKIVKEIALNLDSWSKAYRVDTTVSYLFMMNNHSHFAGLRGTELGTMMGDSWLSGHEEYKDYYTQLYLRVTRNRETRDANRKTEPEKRTPTVPIM